MSGEALVIDASIAVKWLIGEDGTPQALEARRWAEVDRAGPPLAAGAMWGVWPRFCFG
jgi:hypothetical protein